MHKYCYIFWTAKDQEEAKKIVKELLDKKWIACASIFPEVTSLFLWKGKMEEEKEAKVLLKTFSKNFTKICSWIEKRASYEVSEILQVPIQEGSSGYLAWIDEMLEV